MLKVINRKPAFLKPKLRFFLAWLKTAWQGFAADYNYICTAKSLYEKSFCDTYYAQF